MLITIWTTVLIIGVQNKPSATPEVAALLATIETLQEPVEDFRCEFEGSMRFMGRVAEETSKTTKLGPDGLYETVSGRFLYRRGGDLAIDILHRAGAGSPVSRDTIVVRNAEGQAEQYLRGVNSPLGAAQIKKPRDIDAWGAMSVGKLYLIESVKRDIDIGFRLVVSDEQRDGKPYKVVAVSSPERDGLLQKYWFDMARSGQGDRYESYAPDGQLASRFEIKLEPFRVGQAEVWMPVYGEGAGFVATKDGLPIFVKEQTSATIMYVVRGTMVFNQHPSREAFTTKYKPGTPISDSIRQMESEFAQSLVPPKPSKTEAQAMLEEQLKRAEEQKSSLVAVPASGGIPWGSWAAGGFLTLTLAALILYRVQAR